MYVMWFHCGMRTKKFSSNTKSLFRYILFLSRNEKIEYIIPHDHFSILCWNYVAVLRTQDWNHPSMRSCKQQQGNDLTLRRNCPRTMGHVCGPSGLLRLNHHTTERAIGHSPACCSPMSFGSTLFRYFSNIVVSFLSTSLACL